MGEERNYCAIFLSTKETARLLISYHKIEDGLSKEDKIRLDSDDKVFHIPDSIIHGHGDNIDPCSFFLAIGKDDNSITMKSLVSALEDFFDYLPFIFGNQYPLDIEIYDDEDKLKFIPNFNRSVYEYLVSSIISTKEKENGWTIKFIYFGEEE